MKKEGGFTKALVFILTFILGICCVLFIVPLVDLFIETFDNRPIGRLLLGLLVFALIVISIIINTILHEAGHLVCGLISKYKFSSFRIFSLCFVKTEGKVKVKKFSVPGTMGQCLMLPPSQNENGDFPYKLYNFGGALFNLITALICGVLIIFFYSNAFALAILGIILTFALILAINNGIPLRTALIQNDGQNIKDIAKSKEALTAFYHQLVIAEAQSRNEKISEMPSEWFEIPDGEALNNPLVSTIAVLKSSRLMEEGDFYNAHILMREILAKAPTLLGIYKNLLPLEVIYLDAVHGWDNTESIKARFKKQEKFAKAMQKNISVQRILYTVTLLCYGDEKKADKHLDLFEKFAKKFPYPQELEQERKLIGIAREAYNSRNQTINN